MAKFEARQRMIEWITDRLPTDGLQKLITTCDVDGERFVDVSWCVNGEWISDVGVRESEVVFAWAEMPRPYGDDR